MAQQPRPPLMIEDKLLLCQIVYNMGALHWEGIAYKLADWSKERGKIVIMKPNECEFMWANHLRQANLVPPTIPLQQRLQYPYAQPNLELVKRLFVARLQELHRQIKDTEESYHTIKKDITDIRRGAWDAQISQHQPPQEPVVPPTASSSSSQLSSVPSPVPAPTQLAPHTPNKGRTEDAETSHEMEGVEEDVTITTEPTKMDIDAMLVSSPPEPTDKKASDEAIESKLGTDDEEDPQAQIGKDTDDEEDSDEDEEKNAPPARGLRSRKPATEPIEIPASAAARKGKNRKPSDSNTQTSARSSKRRGATEVSKAAHSPATASAAGTFENGATPAAGTDENVSVAGDVSTIVRKSTRGHKRKASEMDVDLPVTSKKPRDRSSTAEEEPMTPAVASGAGRIPNPRLRQAMTQIVTLLISSKHSEIFRRPVAKKDAPDYPHAVSKPIDLSMIQRNIKSGNIGSWDELQRDLRRMLANCCIYNRPGTTAHGTAKLMLEEVEQMLENARESAQN